MIQIKISGATPKLGKSLCTSCKGATVVRGQNCEELVVCHREVFPGDGVVTFKVAECGKYHPIGMPWLHEMEDMAWKIEARKRGPVGFEGGVPQSEMEVVVKPPKSDEKSLPWDA